MVKGTNVYASNDVLWNIGDVWVDKQNGRSYVLKFGHYYFKNELHYGFYFSNPSNNVPFNLSFEYEYNQGPEYFSANKIMGIND